MPTPQVKGRGEGMMLAFLSVLGVWITRPWSVAIRRHGTMCRRGRVQHGAT